MDGAALAHLAKINELKARLGSGAAGATWGNAEPSAPIGGVHTYASLSALANEAAAAAALGIPYQLNFSPIQRAPATNWALDVCTHDPVHGAENPGTGEIEPKWWRIKPEHEADWIAVNQYLVNGVPNLKMIQVGGEADNTWEDEDNIYGSAGYSRAVSLSSVAAKAIRPDIRIMAPGINFGNTFLPGGGGVNTPTALWSDHFFALHCGNADVFSMHMSHIPEAFAGAVAFVKARMAANGYSLPIWADDMASVPFYKAPPVGETAPPWSIPADVDLFTTIEDGPGDDDPPGSYAAALTEYRIRQARFAIIKPVMAFAAGVESVFLSWDVDKPGYWLNIWAVSGLLLVSGARKAAFYAYQQLVAEIDGFVSVKQVSVTGASVYKFTFAGGKPPVVVAWADAPIMVNLSGVMSTRSVRVKTVVTTLNTSNQPIYPPEVSASSRTVPVNTIPALVV